MILKYTWHGAMLEAVHLAKTTGQQQRVHKIVPPGAKRLWWVIEPATQLADREHVEALLAEWRNTPLVRPVTAPSVVYVPPARGFLRRALNAMERLA